MQETGWHEDDVRSIEMVFGGAVTAPVDVRVERRTIRSIKARVHATVDDRLIIVKVSAKDLHFQPVKCRSRDSEPSPHSYGPVEGGSLILDERLFC